ncbi:hypothetical protein OAD66_00670 [Bacteroidia bacterium]|nr:hypothetical protein [Bacteroidia bacterium]MDB4107466.1 hypothetical protein [Bacteroidia bacterium]MDB9881639.1 hypothetical protein [Bacteroidia bacterium]
MNVELTPFVGFGQIKFGQSLEQVKLLLGEATESTREKHEDGTEDVSLLYGELGVELSFMSEDDFRLGLISCYAPTYTVDGQSFNGMSEEDFLKEAKFEDLTQADDLSELKAKDYTIDSKGLSVWIQDGFVDSITMFPDHIDENTVAWPE